MLFIVHNLFDAAVDVFIHSFIDVFMLQCCFVCFFHCEFLPKCHALHLITTESDRHTINVYLLTFYERYVDLQFVHFRALSRRRLNPI